MAIPLRLHNVALSVQAGSIAILKYNRPIAGNAMSAAMMKEVLTSFEWIERQLDIRIVVVTGEGNFYNTGMDLLDKSCRGTDSTVSEAAVNDIVQMQRLLINTDKILISAVNGPAVGWGMTSLALSDLVYATPDAFFFTPFVQWGLCAEGCSSLTFGRIMGRQKASALILLGERMTAAELESAGLVTKVLPREGFLDEVLRIAQRLASQPPQTLRANKKLMMRASRAELHEANLVECQGLRELGKASESKEALEGFAKSREERKKKKAEQKPARL